MTAGEPSALPQQVFESSLSAVESRGKVWPSTGIFAALDLGTNNCRLLIARPARDGFKVIDGFSRIVRLGEKMGDHGMLGEAAMTRTIDALKVCADKIRKRGATHVRCVATEAARRARNCDQFVTRVRREAGLVLEIITSDEEAALTLLGCMPLLDDTKRFALVFDVGGGSGEFVWLERVPGQAPRIVASVSLPCGVVTLTERNGSHDFTREAYAAMRAEVRDMLTPFETEHRIRGRLVDGSAQMLGTAGTVTTIAAVTMGLDRYHRARVDGSFLDFEDVRTVTHNLACSNFEQRAAHPCIGRGRADLVVAGCAVLEAICDIWPAGRLRVADRGVREGLLMRQIAAEAVDGGAPQADRSHRTGMRASAGPAISRV